MAPKKKSKGNKAPWTPERRAKFMATIAKQGKQIRSKKKRKKVRSIEAAAPIKRVQRKNEARSRGVVPHSEMSMSELLDVIAKATEEVQRRLSQLTL